MDTNTLTAILSDKCGRIPGLRELCLRTKGWISGSFVLKHISEAVKDEDETWSATDVDLFISERDNTDIIATIDKFLEDHIEYTISSNYVHQKCVDKYARYSPQPSIIELLEKVSAPIKVFKLNVDKSFGYGITNIDVIVVADSTITALDWIMNWFDFDFCSNAFNFETLHIKNIESIVRKVSHNSINHTIPFNVKCDEVVLYTNMMTKIRKNLRRLADMKFPISVGSIHDLHVMFVDTPELTILDRRLGGHCIFRDTFRYIKYMNRGFKFTFDR